jgi:hypothetical protein
VSPHGVRRFFAVHALDVYTLRDHTAQQAFDIGFVHPDLEEQAYMAFERGDAARARPGGRVARVVQPAVREVPALR